MELHDNWYMDFWMTSLVELLEVQIAKGKKKRFYPEIEENWWSFLRKMAWIFPFWENILSESWIFLHGKIKMFILYQTLKITFNYGTILESPTLCCEFSLTWSLCRTFISLPYLVRFYHFGLSGVDFCARQKNWLWILRNLQVLRSEAY